MNLKNHIKKIVLLISKQVSEIEIQQDVLKYRQRAMFPFFNSEIEIPFNLIKTIELISDQTMTEKGWLLFQKNQKNILNITLLDGENYRINGKIHSKGPKALKELIEKKIRAVNKKI